MQSLCSLFDSETQDCVPDGKKCKLQDKEESGTDAKEKGTDDEKESGKEKEKGTDDVKESGKEKESEVSDGKEKKKEKETENKNGNNSGGLLSFSFALLFLILAFWNAN